jgi:hypothetical protein
LNEGQEQGFFTVFKESTQTNVTIEMPLLVFFVLNEFLEFLICDPSTLDFFDMSWSCAEQIAIARQQ